MTNGAASPWNGFVFFRIIAATSTAATPIAYIPGASHDEFIPATCCIITAPMSAMTGSFAPHGTHVVVMIVSRLSLSFSIVFDAMIPGTPHPEEISSGIKLLPESRSEEHTSELQSPDH